MSPAVVIRTLLIAAGVGVDAVATPAGQWPVFVSTLPEGTDVKDNALCVYDTSGVMDGRIQKTGESIEHPGIQVRIRSGDYAAGFAKAKAAAAALDGIKMSAVTVGAESAKVQSVTRGAVMSLGPEPQNRRRVSFTINGIVTMVSN